MAILHTDIIGFKHAKLKIKVDFLRIQRIRLKIEVQVDFLRIQLKIEVQVDFLGVWETDLTNWDHICTGHCGDKDRNTRQMLHQ